MIDFKVELVNEVNGFKIERHILGTFQYYTIRDQYNLRAIRFNGRMYIRRGSGQSNKFLVDQVVSAMGKIQTLIDDIRDNDMTDSWIASNYVTFNTFGFGMFSEINTLINSLYSNALQMVNNNKAFIAQNVCYKQPKQFVEVNVNIGKRYMILSPKLLLLDGEYYHNTRSTSLIAVDCITGETIVKASSNRVEVRRGDEGYTKTEPLIVNNRRFANKPETLASFNIALQEDGTYTMPNSFQYSRTNVQGDCQIGLGFEVEKEDSDVKDSYSYEDSELLERTGWSFEEDSSLDHDYGFEAVSPVYGMYLDKPVYEQTHLTEALNEVRDIIDADYGSSCGGHINVSFNGMNHKQLVNSIRGYMPLLYALYPNRDNSYAEFNTFNYYGNNKFYAIHIKNYAAEFRIFPAVENVENLLWRCELLRLMIKNDGNNSQKVLAMLANKSSELYIHLRRVYTEGDVVKFIREYVYYARSYNNVRFDGDEQVIQDVSNGLVNESRINDPMLAVA